MVIGFEAVAYEVSEGRSEVVDLCVTVQSGALKTPVEITLSTEDGTASGKSI